MIEIKYFYFFNENGILVPISFFFSMVKNPIIGMPFSRRPFLKDAIFKKQRNHHDFKDRVKK